MEDFLKELFTWICANADVAGYFLFLLLLLSGLFLPISEDLTIIVGGMVAAHCGDGKDYAGFIYFLLLLGSLLSAWEAYWIGRFFGPKIFSWPIINHFIKPKHINRAEQLLAKYGIFSFLIVRFFPGGVRNGFFFTCGLTRMFFPKFILRDTIAGICSTTLLFFIGFIFGENLDVILKNVSMIDEIGLGVAALIIIALLVYYRRKKK